MTKNKNRKTKTRNRMEADGLNYMKARKAVSGNKGEDFPFSAMMNHLIERLDANQEFGKDADPYPHRELEVIRRILTFISESGVKEPDRIYATAGRGISIDWDRADHLSTNIVVDNDLEVNLFMFNGLHAEGDYVFGMSSEDLSQVQEVIMDRVGKPSEWELQLKALVSAHEGNPERKPTGDSCLRKTKELFLKMEALSIALPRIVPLENGGVELLWESSDVEVGVEIDTYGRAVLWTTSAVNPHEYFQSGTVGTQLELQKLVEDHAPLKDSEGLTYRGKHGSYSHEMVPRLNGQDLSQ